MTGWQAVLLKTYCRLELPAWRRLLLPLILQEGYCGTATRTINPHRYVMELDLSQPWERWSYFAGRYYELHTLQLLQQLLRPGDTFVDVGANIGHLTLTAASHVGRTGSVISYEPNPSVFARLKHHVRSNGLNELVAIHNLALGAATTIRNLTVPTEGTGGATLGKLGSEYSGAISTQYQVQVARGDDLCKDIDHPLTIKIDVEGFECAVIMGLTGTIARLLPAILVEAWPEHLANCGSSVEELFALSRDLGYNIYALRTPSRVRGLTRTSRLILERLMKPGVTLTDDVLWLHPRGIHSERVNQLIH